MNNYELPEGMLRAFKLIVKEKEKQYQPILGEDTKIEDNFQAIVAGHKVRCYTYVEKNSDLREGQINCQFEFEKDGFSYKASLTKVFGSDKPIVIVPFVKRINYEYVPGLF